ncbi:MAG: bacteriohemerythrin [Candidatus Wallbacteria bacterium]
MLKFNWENSFSIGIVEIDLQHKKFIDIINDLIESMNNFLDMASVEQNFERLMNYTAWHFGTEEEYMEKFEYPELDIHKAEHNRIFQKIVKIQEQFFQSTALSDENEKMKVLFDLSGFLFEWLIKHIQQSDFKYAELFRKNGLK